MEEKSKDKDKDRDRDGQMSVAALARCCRDKDLATGLQIIADLKARGIPLRGEAQQLRMYLLLQAERVDDMEAVLRELRESGQPPGETHYSLMITAYARLGRADDALKVGGEKWRRRGRGGEEGRGEGEGDIIVKRIHFSFYSVCETCRPKGRR